MRCMERPPFSYDEILQSIAEEHLPQNGSIDLAPVSSEAGRSLHLVHGTLDDREVLVLTETRDNGRQVGDDTHLRKRVVVVDLETNSICHISRTRVSRRSSQDIEMYKQVYIDRGEISEEYASEASEEMTAAYSLLQELYRSLEPPPLPQRIEAVEER